MKQVFRFAKLKCFIFYFMYEGFIKLGVSIVTDYVVLIKVSDHI